MYKRLFIFFIGLCIFCIHAVAQNLGYAQQEILKKLQERGVTPQELEARLKAKGFNPNSVDLTNPVEAANARIFIFQTIDEIANSKNAPAGNPGQAKKEDLNEVIVDKPKGLENLSDNAIQSNTQNIQQAVAEGASFEEAVSETVSEQLTEKLPPAKTWGQQVFRDKKISVYQQSRDAKPPDSYILGIGDRIAVSIWGFSQENLIFEINEEGYIKPEAMPRIYLKGISFGKAKSLIESRFHNYYRFRPEEFEVTLNFSRVITINVVGEVFHYGSFTLPARNTAFNALAAAGGPTDIGSVRNIKLIRAGEPHKKIDIYEFLLNPSAEDKLFLQENDYIHVPMAERLINIKGAVRRPNRYELTEGENLKKLIEYAGGLTVNAHSDNVEIIRTVNGKSRLFTVNLTDILSGKGDFELLNEDVVNIRAIKTPYQNFVKINGVVEIEGEFELTSGMRVSHLVQRAIPKKEARTDFAMLLRKKPDGTNELEKLNLAEILKNPNSDIDILLQSEDEITIYPQSRFVDDASISIEGAVRSARIFPYDFRNQLTVENMVTLAGGLKKDALETAYIFRRDFVDPSKRKYIKINIKSAVEKKDSVNNLILEPFDKIVVYSLSDFTTEFEVSISGAVRSPGNYPYEPGLRISDLIYFSKGFDLIATDFGYIHRIDPYNPGFKEYIRINARNAYENPNSPDNITVAPKDKIYIYSKGMFTDEAFTVKVHGMVREPGEYKIGKGLTLKDVLTMSGGLKFEAAKSRVEVYRLIINDKKETETVMATFTIDDDLNVVSGNGKPVELQEFDQIFVRKVPDFELHRTVTITGEVLYPGNYPLIKKNERLLDIIERAGGLTKEAFPAGAKMYRTLPAEKGYVILRLDKLLKRKNRINQKKYNYVLKPGDEIRIPKQYDLITLYTTNTYINQLHYKDLVEDGKIHVPHIQGKRAYYYIKTFLGGKNKYGSKNRVTVTYPNGRVTKTKNLYVFRIYPKVDRGCSIYVGDKNFEPIKEEVKTEVAQAPPVVEPPKTPIDWGAFLKETISTATATLTFLLLLKTLNKD